jgi:cystathionine beta-lyase/cystathionine gamma-synthase
VSARHRATRAARAGLGNASSTGGGDLAPSPSLSAVRTYADLDTLDADIDTRHSYRRYGDGSSLALEAALADMETPEGGALPVARVTASGQAALGLAITLLASPKRRRVVVIRPCYSGTDALLAGPFGNLGVSLTTVDITPEAGGDHAALVARALGDDVCAVVTEVITNPLMSVIDVPAVAAAAHVAGAACVVDSTFTTPFLFQPFAHGADLVIHSLTKHLGGHSDVLGGVLLVSPQHEAVDWLDGFTRLIGASLSPFDAWLALRGLRTAALRVERGSANAAALVEWLHDDPRVAAVHYPGLHGDDEERLAARLLRPARGPMFSLELPGGLDGADRFVQRLAGIRLAPSLGDAATTVSHPALTSHRSLSRQQRIALGVSDGLVRVSTGIEALSDLRAEMETALG